MTLTTSQIEQIENFLFSEEVADKAMDFYGLHGLVCAAVVGPTPANAAQILAIACEDLDQAPSTEHNQEIIELVELLVHGLESGLIQGEQITPPYFEEDDDYDDGLVSWCEGFVEGFLGEEETWFKQSQEEIAGLLLPIMALSEVFDEDDFEEVRSNKNLMAQFEVRIPELITDIYLFFHADN